jgi:ABC-type sugar transport systems, permease components
VWARSVIILVNIWIGAPFFMIMYLAALKSVPEQLYEAAAVDGANGGSARGT